MAQIKRTSKPNWWKRLCFGLMGLCIISGGIAINCLVHTFRPYSSSSNHLVQQLEIYDHATNQTYFTHDNNKANYQIDSFNNENEFIYSLTNCQFQVSSQFMQSINNHGWILTINLIYNNQPIVISYEDNAQLNVDNTKPDFIMNIKFYCQIQLVNTNYEVTKFTLLNYEIVKSSL